MTSGGSQRNSCFKVQAYRVDVEIRELYFLVLCPVARNITITQ
jgi:hypothetical protein